MQEITMECSSGINRTTFANKEVVFVCIGTDRSTGDSLGPLVGTYLEKLGYENVIGTIDDPCHAENLHERVGNIPVGKTIVAVDSCLGKPSSIGKIQFREGSMKPGAGVGKDLGEVGHYSIKGTVNVGGHMEFFVLQNTRLSIVMGMAERIAMEIVQFFPVTKLQVAASIEVSE